jgi:hypothetical protein
MPLTFAIELVATLPTLTARGLPAMIELAIHGIVTALCAAGAIALRSGAPFARTLVVWGLVGAAVTGIQSLVFTWLPRDNAPGTILPLMALQAAVAGMALLFVKRRVPASR